MKMVTEKILKIVKTLRNNWKKSIFGCVVLSYGVQYVHTKYEINEFMRVYCKEASKYGDAILPPGTKPKRITVILNPAANKRRARKNFDKYCAPLLHVSGILINVVQTEGEGGARSLVENMQEPTDAIVVAGGDGTLSEAVTGLLRRSDGDEILSKKFPIGVLPLGQTNTVATSLFSNDGNDVRMMAEATMAVVREYTKPIDVMKVEALETEKEAPGKPIYSLAAVEWGAYRDAQARRNKYWYWQSLREHASYVFTGLRGEPTVSWRCKGRVEYVLPCAGCSKCHNLYRHQPQETWRWWHPFLPRSRSQQAPKVDYSKVVNTRCGDQYGLQVSTLDLAVATANTNHDCIHEGDPHLTLRLGPEQMTYKDFVSEGWSRANGNQPNSEKVVQVRELALRPEMLDEAEDGKEGKVPERWISIDSEDYEVKPIHITLLPEKLHIFCPQPRTHNAAHS